MSSVIALRAEKKAHAETKARLETVTMLAKMMGVYLEKERHDYFEQFDNGNLTGDPYHIEVAKLITGNCHIWQYVIYAYHLSDVKIDPQWRFIYASIDDKPKRRR